MSAEAARRVPAVFVSFGSAELPAARELAEGLDRVGLPSFFAPRDIAGSMNFAVEIVKAIASCDAVVVLLAPSALASPHVRREVSLAVDERRRLLPVAMPGTVYPVGFSTEWTYWLSAVQVMDYEGPSSAVRRLQQMLSNDLDDSLVQHRPSGASTPRTRTQVTRRPVGRGKGSPSTMLRAERAVISMIGRDSELARLEQWCIRDDDFDARVVTAGAGEGKTRLSLELAQRLRDAGWDTTFLQSSASGMDAALNLSERPHLLVADYAETRVDQLGDFFAGLLDYGIQDKVRLLMLARSATDWWKGLSARSAEIADLLAEATVQPLEPFTTSREAVESLYTTAFAAFSAELGMPAPKQFAAPYRNYSTVLDVLEDALAEVLLDGRLGVGAQSTNRLLSHERGYILAAARAEGIEGLDAVDLDRIAAILTLFGAAEEDQASSLVGECNADIPLSVRRRVARLFRKLYPGTNFYIQGLRPDALAEDLLAGARRGRPLAWWDPRCRGQRAHNRAATPCLRDAGPGKCPPSCNRIRVERSGANGDSQKTLAVAMEVATQVEDPRHRFSRSPGWWKIATISMPGSCSETSRTRRSRWRKPRWRTRAPSHVVAARTAGDGT